MFLSLRQKVSSVCARACGVVYHLTVQSWAASSGFYKDYGKLSSQHRARKSCFTTLPLLLRYWTVWSKNQDPIGPMSPVGLQWALLPSSGKQARLGPARMRWGLSQWGAASGWAKTARWSPQNTTKYYAGLPVPWAFSFSMKPSQFDPLLAGMPSPQIHILNTQLAQLQTRTKTEPGFCQMG